MAESYEQLSPASAQHGGGMEHHTFPARSEWRYRRLFEAALDGLQVVVVLQPCSPHTVL